MVRKLTFLFPYPQRWIIFDDPAVDLTEEIIREIDKEVKVQAKPAAVKPTVLPGGGGGSGRMKV